MNNFIITCFRAHRKCCASILISVCALAFLTCFLPYHPNSLERKNFQSIRIYDRKNVILREILSDVSGTARWTNIELLNQSTIDAFVSTEDKRFFNHPGIDIFAIGRSIYNALKTQHISSGASTITQQLIRIIEDNPRNLVTKIYEIWLAIRLERTLSKRQILEQYLNRAPFGNLCYGIGAASFTYFSKPPSDLTVAESAFLAAILKSPTNYNPYTHFDRTLRRQQKNLERMKINGYLDEKKFQRISKQSIALTEKNRVFRAPHFCDRIIASYKHELKNLTDIYTTLDYNLQRNLGYFVAGRLKKLESSHAHQASVLVMDNHSDEILVWIGSNDYLDEETSGQVDGIIALRQPGSTLKPFTYGLALQAGMTPATVIPDIKTNSNEITGYYTPENYDHRFHGPVTIRQALACSYNVPPVRLLETLGEASLLEVLHRAGFHSLKKSPQFYGKGLTLGNGEVTLLELTRAYAAMVRGGIVRKDKRVRSIYFANDSTYNYTQLDTIGQIFNESVCALLLDILSDNNARVPAFGRNNPLHFPFQCAAKTGTSKDYRDNWVIGCTSDVTVGVWVGNFSGEPMRMVSGISGAGPIFNDVMHYLDEHLHFSTFTNDATLQSVAICPLSGKLPGRACPESVMEKFIPGTAPDDTCGWHVKIETQKESRQSDGSRVFIDLPPIYHQWMIENNIPFVPKDPLSSGIDSTDFEKEKKLVILSPLNNEIYKIDSILRPKYQRIKLRADVPAVAEEVTWYVDDTVFATVAQPFMVHWQLREGDHTFQVRSGSLISNKVKIKVLAAD